MKRVHDLQHGVMGPLLDLHGLQDYFDVPLIACMPARVRARLLASVAIRQAVAPREEEAMLREQFEDTAQRVPHTMRRSPAARCADLLIARYRCSGRGDLDVRALLTPPLAAERMIRLSSNGFSCRNACLTENAPP